MFQPYAYEVIEYRMDADNANIHDVREKLNQLGAQGFHVISVDTTANNHRRRMVWTLERAGNPMTR